MKRLRSQYDRGGGRTRVAPSMGCCCCCCCCVITLTTTGIINGRKAYFAATAKTHEEIPAKGDEDGNVVDFARLRASAHQQEEAESPGEPAELARATPLNTGQTIAYTALGALLFPFALGFCLFPAVHHVYVLLDHFFGENGIYAFSILGFVGPYVGGLLALKHRLALSWKWFWLSVFLPPLFFLIEGAVGLAVVIYVLD